MDQQLSCVDLAAASKVLAASPRVQALVKHTVGADHFPEALTLMTSGRLDGDLGGAVHDLLVDEIGNHSDITWSGVIRTPHDDFPVHVNVYEGVYWAWGMEYDPIGYFLSRDDAIDYARSAWGEVIPDDEEDDEKEIGDLRCPYCDTTDHCDHLLLMVDTTFRQAEGGLLYDAFNARWAATVGDADDPDFDEREPFDKLLDEVSALADHESRSFSDSALGMSANYILFYCRSKPRTAAAAKAFSDG